MSHGTEPLRPPRLSGDPQSDYPALIEYLWSFWRAVTSNFVNVADVGETVQPTTQMLSALAPLVPAADKLPYTTSTSAAALTDFTAFARTILDDADAATVRATLGLGALAQLNSVSTSYIDNDAVTYDKLQNLTTTGVLLGRQSAGAGNVEEILFGNLDHATLGNLNSATYTHLTATNATDLTDAGDSALHFHSADRARANHTGTQAASTVLLEKIGSATYSTVQEMNNLFHSSGYFDGGEVTDNGDGTVAVAAGTGTIRATASELATVKFFDWVADSVVAITPDTPNWIYIDYNAGSPVVSVSTVEPTEHYTKIKLAVVFYGDSEMHINTAVRYLVADHAAHMVEQMQAIMPYAHASGAILGETGARNLAISEGVFWHGLVSFTTAALDTSVSGEFHTYHRDGLGGWTHVTGATQVNNTQYDDGSGVLAALSANRYTNRWVYSSVDSDVHIIYGQTQDSQLADIVDEQPPASIPPELMSDSFLIGRIIVREGVATLVQVDSAYDTHFSSSAVSVHNDLSGLQGGTANEFYHLTSAEYTGSGTGAFARVNSPVFTTPNIGSATGSVSGTSVNVTGIVAIANGGTGQDTAQEAIDALSQVSAATNEYVLTKDTATGNALWKVAASGSLADGDKGDITVSASGATWTIDNDVVTFAKMQNVDTAKVLGRSTAGSGDVEQLATTGTGNVVLSASPTLTGTIDCANITPAGLIDISGAAAGQIKFPAAQNASADANTLDDYEEGTYTPTVTGATVVGTPTYSGFYTKIGRQVRVVATFTSTTSISTASKTSAYFSLPFPKLSGLGGLAVGIWNNFGTNADLGNNTVDGTGSYFPQLSPQSNIMCDLTYFTES
jgi:hypothetical protein